MNMMTAKVFENGRSQAVNMFSDDFMKDGRTDVTKQEREDL